MVLVRFQGGRERGVCQRASSLLLDGREQVRPPMAPTHLFLLDASYAAVSSGLLVAACSAITSILDDIQGRPPTPRALPPRAFLLCSPHHHTNLASLSMSSLPPHSLCASVFTCLAQLTQQRPCV